MAITDKIEKIINTIENVNKKIKDINDKYGKQIEQINEQLSKLNELKDSSEQYINTQIAKLQKQYDDICKTLTDKIKTVVDSANIFISNKIKELTDTAAGELGVALGLPPETAKKVLSAAITPILSAIPTEIPMPPIVFPELKIPEIKVPDIPEVNTNAIPTVNIPTINIPNL